MLKEQKNPVISVIIVNWNGKKWLSKCLESLRFQTHNEFEIIFVDNHSSDESVSFVKDNYPDIRIVVSPENKGFAGGNNLGIDVARGKYILLLNSDTWVEPKLLEGLQTYFEKNDYDLIGPYEAHYDGQFKNPYRTTIDPFGHPVYLGVDKKPNFYLSGVCVFFTKDLYTSTEGLDEGFFMYFEEIDWFWRLNLLNKKFCYVPDLFVYHAGAGSTGAGIKYNSFLWRNQNTLQMLIKNYRAVTLLLVIPIYLLQNIFEILFFLILLKPKIARSYIEGWFFNIKNLPRILKRRKSVQAKRLISDSEILKSHMYLGLGKMHHLIKFYRKSTDAK